MTRNTKKREAGTSMLEMVIVLPVLLMLLFAILEFGLLFGRWLTINNAAREGAREAIVFRVDCDPTQVQSDVVTRVQNYTSVFGLSVGSGDIDVQGVCGTAGSDSTVIVNVPYNFRVLAALAPSVGPSVNLRGSTSMRNEGSS